MTPQPDFDPFELLGVDASADAATIDRAYKARIRYVHPDIAGTAGLNETKRLNIAREWLLDPELRVQLPKPARSWRRHATSAPPPQPAPRPSSAPPPTWATNTPRRARASWEYDPLDDDPITFDYGPQTHQLRAFFDVIRSLSSDERARVTYSLGDEPPFLFDEFKTLVNEQMWGRSRALEDAIERVWAERGGEDTPLLFPRGRVFGNGAVVANAHAQWVLLGDAIREGARDGDTVAALQSRGTWAWEASVRYSRYGANERETLAFFDDARALPLQAAERLARSWQGHMGTYLYGRPGEDWFPGAFDQPKPNLVSARLAAVDASRIEPPVGMSFEDHSGFRCGLRLTAHVLTLGSGSTPGRDYLRPWRDALDTTPSFRDRARWGMPLG